jgi:quercetin dioxygenase-like cupin family protein
MRRIALLAVFALLLFAVPAIAQDPVEVDPDHYAVEFENDQIRVLRITYGPGESSVMHEHPAAFAVLLTDGQMIMHHAEGEDEAAEWGAGETNPTDATVHSPENIGDNAIEVLLIEFKAHDDHDDDYDAEDEGEEGDDAEA